MEIPNLSNWEFKLFYMGILLITNKKPKSNFKWEFKKLQFLACFGWHPSFLIFSTFPPLGALIVIKQAFLGTDAIPTVRIFVIVK